MELPMLAKTPTKLHIGYAIQPPELGAAILYRGLGDTICEGIVTQLRHIETRPGQPNKWGAFLDTSTGPVFINDYRYLQTK
jgi:hypothetical protein